MLIPFGFTAELEDGSKVGYADKPVMIAEGASEREIEQTILSACNSIPLSLTFAGGNCLIII